MLGSHLAYRAAVRNFGALAVFLTLIVAARAAYAHPWMIRHSYPQCTPCHLDPTGAGPLTRYGRGMSDEVLRTSYPGETQPPEEGRQSAEFLWGVFDLPESLLLSGDLRLMHLRQKIERAPLMTRTFVMQADFEAAVRVGNLVAAGSLGYAQEGARAASITRGAEDQLVSRQHWVGAFLAGDALLVRAGRLNLPFGIRSIEHTLWVRRHTRTSINDDQQHGLAVAVAIEGLRAEILGIVGNFQLRPDAFRERGYSGHIEWSVIPELALGASSLVTHRQLDPAFERPSFRQAHGVSARWASGWLPLVLMTEWNYSVVSPRYLERRKGVVGFVQADLELLRGIHLIATGEFHNVGTRTVPASQAAWLSYAWFFAPHVDLRIDAVYQRLGSAIGHSDAVTLLLQTHLWL